MATLELSGLAERLGDDELREIAAAVEEATSQTPDLSETGDSAILEHGIDDDILNDFQDRLDANDASADIYLPLEFEDVIEAGDYRLGSAHALLLVLENLKEDFFIDDDDEEDEVAEDDEEYDFDDEDHSDYFKDEDVGIEMKDEQLRHIWRLMYQGAQVCVRKGLCLFVRS